MRGIISDYSVPNWHKPGKVPIERPVLKREHDDMVDLLQLTHAVTINVGAQVLPKLIGRA
jgi:hypothetical protein